MKKRVILSTATAICGISAYCAYTKKINNPFMSKKEIQAFVTAFSQPYGKKENLHPGNILFSKRCSLGTDPAHTGINNHVLVLGGSGDEKKELMQANLLQRNGSYVVMDPSGEILATTGAFFEQNGYRINVLKLTDETNSMHYNPMCYLEEEADIRMMARCLLEIQPFDNMGTKAAELALLEALILYFWRFQPKNKGTLNLIYKIIEEMGKTTHAVMGIFDEVASNNPDELCLKRFQHFKELAEADLPGIVADITKRLSYLNSEKIKVLTSDDDMDLKQTASTPTIIYIVTGSETEESGWLSGMLVTQMLDILSNLKKSGEAHRLKYPVRFLLDSFCSHASIKGFPNRISSNRRLLMREVSFLLFAGSMEEVHDAYSEELESLLFTCDTVLCYQSARIKSGEEISRLWGGECVKTHNHKAPSYRITSRFDAHDLLNADPDQVVIIVRGLKPIRDTMFQIEDHLDANQLGTVGDHECIFSYIRPFCLKPPSPKARVHKTERQVRDNGK